MLTGVYQQDQPSMLPQATRSHDFYEPNADTSIMT
jgi:hypothetical protein